jgi:hypothetical protein
VIPVKKNAAKKYAVSAFFHPFFASLATGRQKTIGDKETSAIPIAIKWFIRFCPPPLKSNKLYNQACVFLALLQK